MTLGIVKCRQVRAGRAGRGDGPGRLRQKRNRRDEHTGEHTTDHGGSLQAGLIIGSFTQVHLIIGFSSSFPGMGVNHRLVDAKGVVACQ